MYESLKQIHLSLLHTGHVFLNKNWDYDNVISPFSRLYYIVNGSGKVYHHGQGFDLKPGYMYLVPSFTYSRYKCDDFLEQYYVHFLEEVGEGLSIFTLKAHSFEEKGSEWDLSLFKKLIALNPDRNLLRYNPETYDNQPVLLKLKEQNKSLGPVTLLQNQGILLALLAYFLKEKRIQPQWEGGSAANRISPIFEFIQKNLNQKLSVTQLATFSNLNPDYFSRLFQKHTGFRPMDYIHIKRIERAQLLLATTDNTLSEIAFKVGMPNYSHFTRTFRKVTSISPTDFRKEHWK